MVVAVVLTVLMTSCDQAIGIRYQFLEDKIPTAKGAIKSVVDKIAGKVTLMGEIYFLLNPTFAIEYRMAFSALVDL